MASTLKIPAQFIAIDKMSDVIRGMTKNIRTFSDKSVAYINRIDHKLNTAFNSMSKFSQLLTGLAVGSLFSIAVQGNIAYNDSLASVSAITGAVGNDLTILEKLSQKTGKAQKMLGTDVLKAYELIGSAKPELLQNSKLLDEVTNSAILLSHAGRMEMVPAAEALTTALNQFGLGGEHSKKIIDSLAAGAKYGSSQITQSAEALSKFGTIAAATGTKVDESIALIELVSPFEKGAEAGTKLRNILAKIAGAKILPQDSQKMLKSLGVNIDLVTNKSIPLNDRLLEFSKVLKDNNAIGKIFGAENAGLAQGLFDNVKGFDEMLKKVRETGVAEDQASKNTNTLAFALKSIKTAYINTTTATNSNNKALEISKKLLFGIADYMGVILTVGASIIGLYATMKAGLIALKIATFAYNVAIGISAARMGAMAIVMKGNTVAMTAFQIATKAMTAAQWLLNVAMTANPIGLIIVAIGALIAVVVMAVKHWESWGAAVLQFMGPLGWVINLIMSFRKHWDMLKNAFKTEGIIGGLKAIGKVLLDAVLIPTQQILKLLAKIPGVGALATPALNFVENTRKNLGLTDPQNAQQKAEIIPSSQVTTNQIITNNNGYGKIDLTVKDDSGKVQEIKKSGTIPINITPTIGAF